jgi:hypothetical protein
MYPKRSGASRISSGPGRLCPALTIGSAAIADHSECRSEETASTKRRRAFLEPIEHQLDVFSTAEFSRNLKGI